jgi:hypothetical protein
MCDSVVGGKIVLGFYFTKGGFIEVDTLEEAEKVKQMIKNYDYEGLESKMVNTFFESDYWDESPNN